MIALVDVTIKVSALVLVALAVARLSRRRSAAARHCVLASALACVTVVPLVGLAVPSWRIDWPAPPPPQTQPVAVTPSSFSPVETSVRIAAPLDARAAAAVPPGIENLVVPVWLVGTGFSLAILLVGLGRLVWIAAHARRIEGGRWIAIAASLAREYGLASPPRLLQGDHPALLVTWGWARPQVLLPAGADAWTDERIRVVLAHELAHVRRRDWLAQIGAELVRSAYWFNPLLWIACARLRQESEQACDDAVLRCGVGGASYAAHLLDLARAFRAHRVWLPAAAIARPSRLERRVHAMLSAQTDRRAVTPMAAALTFMTFLGVTAAVAGFDVFAQTRFATVSGTIVDQSGGVLVNATLVLSNLQTNAKNEVRTNQTGFYEFVGLPAGSYELEIRQLGFTPAREPLSLSVGEALQRNVMLPVSAVQETITMIAGPAAAAPSEPRVAPSPARRPCPSAAVGGCIRPPVKVKDVRPVYPASLSEAGIEGVVLLEANLASDGTTRVVRVVSSPHPELERAAVDAVSQWEFAPTTLNGTVIDTPMNVSVTFRLPEAGAQP